MKTKYTIKLPVDERERLLDLIAAGTLPARVLMHRHILLKADSGEGRPGWSDQQIAEAFEVSPTTAGNVRRRYAKQGLEAALYRAQPQRVYERRLDGEQEAHLIALACSAAPEDRARWTLRLLAERLVELEVVERVSHETVRQVLKKANLSRG